VAECGEWLRADVFGGTKMLAKIVVGIDSRRHGDSIGWAGIYDPVPRIRGGKNFRGREARRRGACPD
jgi:hypothetical protein